ncbi:MAG: DUF973 family protein [Anaerolineaceae bacterium]|nr:DUF973 family protein [Anaerolineaceae bacterium]
MGNKKKSKETDKSMTHLASSINKKDDFFGTPVMASGPDSETPLAVIPKNRIRFGLTFTVIGYLIFLLGVRPGLFGLDRSKVIGFVQITVFLIGLAIIVIGAYITLSNFWPKSKSSLLADFGVRVISTGYVICVFTALADIFGFGSHHLPNVFFGPLQANGVEIGMIVIGLGFIMMIRFDHRKRK